MFRLCLGQSSRLVASSPSALGLSPFHTSQVGQKAHRSVSSRKSNLAIHKERRRTAQSNKAHVVLGTRPNEESKWQNCDLAKVLVSEENILSRDVANPVASFHASDTFSNHTPHYLNFGIGEAEKKALFEHLPYLSAQEDVLKQNSSAPTAWVSEKHAEAERRETDKVNVFAKVVDLQNANARGIAYENRRRVIEEFSEPALPWDPGRPEVQAALLTMKIRNVWSHLTRFRRDIANRRSLRKLVHERAKILRYLKRLDRDRYDRVLLRLALESESVEGELVV